MALCPKCSNDVKLAWHSYLSGLPHHLTCPFCKSRLERTSSGSAVVLGFLVMLIPLLHSLNWVVQRAGLIVIAALFCAALVQLVRPKLKLRTKLPEPDVFLKI